MTREDSCLDDDDCRSNEVCVKGECLRLKDDGETCHKNEECRSGTCQKSWWPAGSVCVTRCGAGAAALASEQQRRRPAQQQPVCNMRGSSARRRGRPAVRYAGPGMLHELSGSARVRLHGRRCDADPDCPADKPICTRSPYNGLGLTWGRMAALKPAAATGLSAQQGQAAELAPLTHEDEDDDENDDEGGWLVGGWVGGWGLGLAGVRARD